MAMKLQALTGLTYSTRPTAPASYSRSSSGSAIGPCVAKKPLVTSFFNGGGAFFSAVYLWGYDQLSSDGSVLLSLDYVHMQSLAVILGTIQSLKTFHIRAVGALRVAGISCPKRCGSLGAQMNLFERFARVVKSYANALVSSLEDPEKILEQTVLEMNDDLIKMRQATAQVIASQKRLENKYKAAEQASGEWYRKAQLALEKGDEDLAREALKRRKSYADNANALKSQYEQQKNVVDNLVSNTRLLESKIQEAKSKKDTLRARAQSAKTASKVNEMLGNVNTSNALSAFEKMEEKVLAMESQAEALGQLTTDDLEGKFALLESSSVDSDLENLKKELSATTKKGELPPGRTLRFEDAEVEKELNELRQKAKEL